jgi:hypothetical protein
MMKDRWLACLTVFRFDDVEKKLYSVDPETWVTLDLKHPLELPNQHCRHKARSFVVRIGLTQSYVEKIRD